MFSPSIEKLIKLFSKFPTVGPRTAARFVFYLIKTPREEIEELIKSIEELKSKIKVCSSCYKSFEEEGEFCPICSDPRRDKSTVCIVEKEVDLETLEKTNQYKGLYFILGGTIPSLGKDKDKEQEKIAKRLEKLIDRLKAKSIVSVDDNQHLPQIKELILALNPTPEGQSTSLWLQRRLRGIANIKITQLGRGLPLGGELEYADEETLISALEGRR